MVRHKDDGCSQEKDVKTYPRDSGYESLSSRLSILDRLLHTHSIWLQLNLSEEEAAEVLQSQPPGVRLRTSRKQVEAGSAATSLKTKRLRVLESSLQPVGNTVPDMYLGCNAGKFPWQLQNPSQFVFLRLLSDPQEVQDSAGQQVTSVMRSSCCSEALGLTS